MNTKILMKVMAVIAIVCLPFVIASCSKEDSSGPVTHDYNWDITGFTIPNNNDSIASSWMNARAEINKLMATAIRAKGFSNVDANAKTFNIEIDRDASITPYDEKVTMAILEMKATTAFQKQAQKLPESAMIIVKRGKTTVDERNLR